MGSNKLIHLGNLAEDFLFKRKFINREGYIAPRDELEERICHLWSEILMLPQDQIGIHDDFFRLGGNSILAIKLARKLNEELDSNINFAVIFKYNTVNKVSYYLKNNTDDKIIIETSKINKAEEQLLSFAQERLFFIENYETGTNAYNIPMVFKLSNNMKLDILETSIKSVVARHEILRTLIKEDNEGHRYQLVLDDKEHPVEIIKIKVINQVQLEQELKKSVNYVYDLSNEYPIRICLYELKNKIKGNNAEHYLSIVVHHIAFDGWSSEIFLRELYAYYNYNWEQLKGLNPTLSLPDLSIQYKDFALWQRSYVSEDKLEKQLSYWKNKLSGYETLNLITDKIRPAQVDYVGQDIYFEIDEDVSVDLRELAKEFSVSLYSLLRAGYYLMLRSYSNQNDIVVGATIANQTL